MVLGGFRRGVVVKTGGKFVESGKDLEKVLREKRPDEAEQFQ